MAFGRIRSKKPDPDDVPPPPPPNMFDPDVIEAADEDAQKYKEKASQEVTVKAYKKGTVGTGSSSNKKWYILGALLLVAVIVAAAVGGAMAGKGNSGSGSTASSTTGSSSIADDFGSGGTSGGGTTGDVEVACVPCTDIPTEFMVAEGGTCATYNNFQNRCGTPGSWWFDDRDWDDDWNDAYPPQSYCQYSCYQAGVGYPDFSPCCPDVVDDFLLDGTKGDQDATAAEDGPCIPCTDIPDEFMLDNGSDCLTDDGIVDLCGKDGSWWYNLRDWDDDWVDPYAAETYCQYSCDARGLPYPSASNCCAERGSDVNEFYNYGGDVADVAEVVVTPEPTPTPIPEFGDLDVDGDCDGEDDDFCGLCQGDCDDDIDCEDGYFCFQRDEDEDVPGCNGDAEDGIDYCIPEFYRGN